MCDIPEIVRQLGQIPNVTVREEARLAEYTRFGIGGPADVYVETDSPEAFIDALRAIRTSGVRYVVIGGGTNLIVSDQGFRGVVLRYTGEHIDGAANMVKAEAGAKLQDVVDFAVSRGLKGIETLAGIPGSFGAAIYGNAGAYGHSVSEVVSSVLFADTERLRECDRAACEFAYRESVFKRHKDWVIFSAELVLEPSDSAGLQRTAGEIVALRSRKFPPTMKCAGSIFKNLILRELPAGVAAQVPERVVKEGKVPAAYFLEEAGAKGLTRGGIHVAEYHANLIYNAGDGTARQLRALIAELKTRVRARFGLDLEEEVQYVGFDEVQP